MSQLREQVGGRVRELRLALRWTQEHLAERAGLSYKFVGEVERGMANPTLDTLASLASALDVDLTQLLAPPAASRFSSVSPSDYTIVRDALSSIETVLRRAGPPPRRSRKR